MASRKGSPNRIGSGVKSNIIGVFEKIGGRDKMAEWALENLTEFYRLYARLVPTEVVGTIDIRDARELTEDELLAYLAAAGSARTVEQADSEAITGEVH